MTKIKGQLKLPIIVLLLAILAFVIFNALKETKPSPALEISTEMLNTALVTEFNDAYPAEFNPTGKIVDFNLKASVSELLLPNGQTEKLFAYNNQVPGPEIRIKLGDTLKVNFTNELAQDSTIHFHGVRVPNAMDGVPGVTQEPIKPGNAFSYEFTPKDAGTYWFHPHVRTSEQLEKGLYGVLIVEETNPKPYSQDITWVLDDWRLNQAGGLDDRFNTRHDLMHDGRWGQLITVNGSADEILNVNQGERIRLRLVNVSNARTYLPEFPGLTAYVIAVDGMSVSQPFVYDGFDLAPGNRLDLDIAINATSELAVIDTFTSYANKLATISVSDKIVETPKFELDEHYVPSWVNANSMPLDEELRLNARRGGKYGIEWTINNQVLGEHTPLNLEYGKFNRLRFTNESGRLHPMHLHGQFFKVLARNGVPSTENFWRDTVLVKPREVLDIGLIPLDKGSWASHCHILEHAEAGMMTVLNVE